LLLWVKGRFSA